MRWLETNDRALAALWRSGANSASQVHSGTAADGGSLSTFTLGARLRMPVQARSRRTRALDPTLRLRRVSCLVATWTSPAERRCRRASLSAHALRGGQLAAVRQEKPARTSSDIEVIDPLREHADDRDSPLRIGP